MLCTCFSKSIVTKVIIVNNLIPSLAIISQGGKIYAFLDHRGPTNLKDNKFQANGYRFPLCRKFLPIFYFS